MARVWQSSKINKGFLIWGRGRAHRAGCKDRQREGELAEQLLPRPGCTRVRFYHSPPSHNIARSLLPGNKIKQGYIPQHRPIAAGRT